MVMSVVIPWKREWSATVKCRIIFNNKRICCFTAHCQQTRFWHDSERVLELRQIDTRSKYSAHGHTSGACLRTWFHSSRERESQTGIFKMARDLRHKKNSTLDPPLSYRSGTISMLRRFLTCARKLNFFCVVCHHCGLGPWRVKTFRFELPGIFLEKRFNFCKTHNRSYRSGSSLILNFSNIHDDLAIWRHNYIESSRPELVQYPYNSVKVRTVICN